MKTDLINFRIDPDDHAHLKRLAAECGLTLTDYIIFCTTKPHPELAKKLSTLSRHRNEERQQYAERHLYIKHAYFAMDELSLAPRFEKDIQNFRKLGIDATETFNTLVKNYVKAAITTRTPHALIRRFRAILRIQKLERKLPDFDDIVRQERKRKRGPKPINPKTNPLPTKNYIIEKPVEGIPLDTQLSENEPKTI